MVRADRRCHRMANWPSAAPGASQRFFAASIDTARALAFVSAQPANGSKNPMSTRLAPRSTGPLPRRGSAKNVTDETPSTSAGKSRGSRVSPCSGHSGLLR